MEYMLLIATDTEPEEPPDTPEEIQAWVTEGRRRGLGICGDPLAPLETAVTVRVRDGELLVTDGPHTESKEWIVGYDILDCANLDETIDYVSRHPMARRGRIEIRPVAKPREVREPEAQ